MNKVSKVERNFKGRPSSEYRFLLYDPEGDGAMFFLTAEERDAYAKRIIPEYCLDGWSESEDVEYVFAGEVTHTTVKTNIIKRPPEDEINEDGEDEKGNWWDGDMDEMCDYELKKVTP